MTQETFDFCRSQSPLEPPTLPECYRFLEWYEGSTPYVTSWDDTRAAWVLLLIEAAKHVAK